MTVTKTQTLTKAMHAAANRFLREQKQIRAEHEDPRLPFILVHRSVAAKAATIAYATGLDYRFVRGALAAFWESFADRRLLAGKTELVLTSEDTKHLIATAFGRSIDLQLMVSLGFLEPRPDGYRVRGFRHLLRAQAMADGKAVQS